MKRDKRYWVFKTTSGGNIDRDYWDDFKSEKVIALGWERLGDLGDYKSDNQFLADIRKNYPRPGGDRHIAHIARMIRLFVDEFQEGDGCVICRGFAPNQKRPVWIYGFAEIGQYNFDGKSSWWKYKRKSTIRVVEHKISHAQIVGCLNRRSLRLSIHEISADAFNKLERKFPE